MKNGPHIPDILCSLLAILPVTAVSCTVHEAVPTHSCLACSSFTLRAGTPSVSSCIEKVDSFLVLVFDDDRMARLDACLKVVNPPTRRNAREDMSQSYVSIHSTSGQKIAVFLANLASDRLGAREIMSYESLCCVMQDISQEDPNRPVLSAVNRFTAGGSDAVDMLPLLAKIRVTGVNFDFSSRPYASAKVSAVRLYLTNVSSLHPLVQQDSIPVTSVINQGRFDPVQCSALSHPEMLSSEVTDGAELYCYPGNGTSSPIGPTRLVVEAAIDTATWYYPINVCSLGVKSGHCYSFDITVTRTGSTDPDTPVESGTIMVNVTEDEWNEYENEVIDY